MSVTLDQLKAHLNITDTTDDIYLTDILTEAVAYVEGFVGPLSAFTPAPPADLARAIKLLCGHWYESREAATAGADVIEVPLSFWDVVNQHRSWYF